MESPKPAKNLGSNFLWAGLLALLGFLHPLFFLGGAFVAWLAWQQLKNPDDCGQPVGSGRRPMVVPDQADWEEGFLAACDSPAEEAFVSAAIRHFGMQPCMGLLKGGGLTLQLQVQIGRFRVDFLADQWLVIEVDGAAWHLSAEAVTRDAERDECLVEDGYYVLRLPAKLVFDQPLEAMRRVEGAMRAGKPQRPARSKPEVNFAKAIAGIGTFIDEVNDFAQRRREVEQALRPARDVVATERMLLEGALECARAEIDIKELRGKSAEHARHFDENYARLRAALEDYDNTNGRGRQPLEPIHLMPLIRPPEHSDAVTKEEIQAAYDQLVSDRERFFEDVRQKTTKEPHLETHAREYLSRYACERLWDDATCNPTRRKARSRIVPGKVLRIATSQNNKDIRSRSSALGAQSMGPTERRTLIPTERRGPPLEEWLSSQAAKPNNSS